MSDKKKKQSSSGSDSAPRLYPCVPEAWLWMPKPLRTALAWITMVLFSASFLVVPIAIVGLPLLWALVSPRVAMGAIAFLTISFFYPQREWEWFRTVGQLWYETLQFSCNLSPEDIARRVKLGEKGKYAIGMHPHGIVPIQALLWAAYCDQYMRNENGSMYGFGATADVVGYLPVLRNIMGWLTAGSAEYKVLKRGLEDGICESANRAGRKPKHLYILPGGIAEIFVSTPGKHAIIFKHRKGLIRLAIETGVSLVPCYVFGGTDFFENLATGQNLLSRISRKFRMGLTIFWGHFGLPIPYAPRVTMCLAEPMDIPKWTGEGKIPQELIDETHAKYIQSIQDLFEKYKTVAGYPDGELEVH